MGKSFNPILHGSASFTVGAGGFPASATPDEASVDLSSSDQQITFQNTNPDLVGGVVLASLAGADADKFRLLPPSPIQGADYATLIPPLGSKAQITFDPDRINVDTILSSDLKEFYSGIPVWRSAIAPYPLTSGKWYWEVERVSSTTVSGVIGIGRISQDTTDFVGNDSYGWSNTTGSGGGFAASYHDSAVLDASYMPYWRNDGDVVMLAYDADNGLFWMGVNGTWGGGAVVGEIEGADGSNVLATVPAGLSPIVSVYDGQTLRLRSEASELSYPIPTGFQALEEYGLNTIRVVRTGGVGGAELTASIDVISSEGEYSIPVTATVPLDLKAVFLNRSADHIFAWEAVDPIGDTGLSASPIPDLTLETNAVRVASAVPGCLGALHLTEFSSRAVFNLTGIADMGFDADRSWVWVFEQLETSWTGNRLLMNSDDLRGLGEGRLPAVWRSNISGDYRLGLAYFGGSGGYQNLTDVGADAPQLVYLAISYDSNANSMTLRWKELGGSLYTTVKGFSDSAGESSSGRTLYFGYVGYASRSKVHFFSTLSRQLTEEEVLQDLNLLEI